MTAPLRLLSLACLALLALPLQAQQAFPTREAAAEALVAALGTTAADEARLRDVLGADWERYIPRGSVEREDVDAFLARYREQHAFQSPDASHALLTVGKDAWSLPVPLAKGADGWKFDLKAGEPEIRARRIGRNEHDALQAALAYHDAQMDYAAVDRNGDGVLEYARRFLSSDGQHDGLYWDDADGGGESPLGPLFGDDDTPDGVWHGYRYRILTAQGPSARRGAYSYLIGDRMTRGFALVAWPAKYGDSGVMSFIVSHDGEVFEKDLGPDGDAQARAMARFDPDSSWKLADDAAATAAAR
ncbi:MAG TPA: DUF2950 domain-containing protein [Lysobacter sp.]